MTSASGRSILRDPRPSYRWSNPVFPSKQDLTLCFAHVAYQFQGLFERRKAGIKSFQVWNRTDLDDRIGEADVLVISGLWRNDLIERGKKLRYVQAIGAGTDQFSRELLSARGLPVRPVAVDRADEASSVDAEVVERDLHLLMGEVRYVRSEREHQRCVGGAAVAGRD